MSVSKVLVAAACVVMSVPAGVAAHHSFAMFDSEREVWLEGRVKAFQWTNPHTFIQIEVNDGSRTVEWSLEGGSPNILSRNGWNRNAVKPGDRLRVLIHPLRSGRAGGTFLEVHKPDGSVYYYHG